MEKLKVSPRLIRDEIIRGGIPVELAREYFEKSREGRGQEEKSRQLEIINREVKYGKRKAKK